MSLARSDSHWDYDVTVDGERFVMFPGTGDDGWGDVTIVTSWFAELKRMVPNQE